MTSYGNANTYASNTGAKIEIRSTMDVQYRDKNNNIKTYKPLVSFLAFVTSFNDSFTSNWNTENVYGRQDPIGTFQGTTRVISLNFDVVAFSEDDAKDNLKKINTLTNMLYPTYNAIEGQSNALSLSKAPLVEMKFANLIQENSGFLLGWISSFSANPVIDMGMFSRDGKLYPKVHNASLTFNPQHRAQLGTVKRTIGNNKDPLFSPKAKFPYDGGR